MTQQDFPDLRIVAYMDDISIIGSFESISRVSEDIAAKYKEIGLALNPSKCLLIGREKQSLMIGGAQIPFINYDQQAFKLETNYTLCAKAITLRLLLNHLCEGCHLKMKISSALVTTIPQVYGTLLSDSAWTLNMRFRSFIWPDNLPHNLICKCSREITTTHLLNCKHFITFRSKVHDAVRDQLYCMCKSHRIESFLEPLLSNLFDAENDFHKNNRGDVILPGLDGSFILLDVMSVDPCNASNERLVNSEIHNPLSNAENFKFKNTMNLCPNWPVYSMQNTICIHLFRIKLNFKNKENENENTFGKRRADLITPASDGVIKVVDVVTVDVCKDSAIDFAKRDETPLCFAEKSKFFLLY
ncbi:hypothetical protein P9112_001122 [Eukaryota sp. TZLM1-RC]